MIDFNPNVSSSMPIGIGAGGQSSAKPQGNPDFADAIKAVEKNISSVDDAQHSSEVSIQDLLSGKNSDITTVVTEVAKADMSFKLLVGVRNKLIEAYKQTMNMPI
jgi:flagellar hook-basal body complex protein FliE